MWGCSHSSNESCECVLFNWPSIFNGKVMDLPIGRASILTPNNQVPELPIIFCLAPFCILVICLVPAGLELVTTDEVTFEKFRMHTVGVQSFTCLFFFPVRQALHDSCSISWGLHIYVLSVCSLSIFGGRSSRAGALSCALCLFSCRE